MSTPAPGALGSTMGLLQADSSGQRQREHPASSAGSAPGRGGGGGRTSFPSTSTKPWQPGLPEALEPRIWGGSLQDGWTGHHGREGRSSPQRPLVKAGASSARGARPSHDPAPTASPCQGLAAPPAQRARLPSPFPNPLCQQKPCGSHYS